jgi:hypothetical protein
MGAALSLSAQSANYLLPGSSSLDRLGGACPMHLFQPDERCNKCLAADADQQQAGRTISSAGVSSYAFRNPYFTERQAGGGGRDSIGAANFSAGAGLGRARDSPAPGLEGGPLEAASSSEQMHFIESHIADLHNRQVTSSVKELSSLGEYRLDTVR